MGDTQMEMMDFLKLSDRMSVYIFIFSQLFLPLLFGWYLSHLKFLT